MDFLKHSCRDFYALMLASLVVTSILVFGTVRIESTYLKNFPRFFDPAAYDSTNIALFRDVEEKGRFNVAVAEFETNSRNPIRTIPLVLFYPKALSKQFGHLLTAVPLLYTFILLLGLQSLQKSHSLTFAVAAMSAFCAVPGLLDPTEGFAANWLDMPAAAGVAAAALSLLQFCETRKLSWLALFGCLATCAVTARWAAAPYLALYSGPVLLMSVLKCGRVQGLALKALLTVAASSGLGVIFVIRYLIPNLSNYQAVGYALNADVASCVSSTWFALNYYVQPILLILLTLLIGSNLFWTLRTFHNNDRLSMLAANIWLPCSISIFICFIARSANVVHPTLYLVPALYVSAFATDSFLVGRPKASLSIAIALLVVSVFVFGRSFTTFVEQSSHPNQEQAKTKQVDQQFADYLAQRKLKTYAEFDNERVMAGIDSFYKWGWFPHAADRIFTIHDAYWKYWYPNATGSVIGTVVYSEARRKVELILVHENLADIDKNIFLKESISRDVSTYMTKSVSQSPDWMKVMTIDGPNGKLAMFENRVLTHP